MNDDIISDLLLYGFFRHLEAIKELIHIGLALLCILLLCLALNKVIANRAETIMLNWVKEKQYQLLFYKRQRPYKLYRIFYIEVLAPSGVIKRGYIRCGDLLLGVLVNAVDISWEE